MPGLTGPVLIVMLAAALALAVGGIMWAWPRLAGAGVRWFGLRLTALCVVQIVMLALVFVAVNDANGFFSSWSDLFGRYRGGGTLKPLSGGGQAPTASLSVLAATRVQTARGRPGGTLQTVRIRGQLSGLTEIGHVYLPPGYPGRSRDRRYPVIVVITAADAGTAPGAANGKPAANGSAAAGRGAAGNGGPAPVSSHHADGSIRRSASTHPASHAPASHPASHAPVPHPASHAPVPHPASQAPVPRREPAGRHRPAAHDRRRARHRHGTHRKPASHRAPASGGTPAVGAASAAYSARRTASQVASQIAAARMPPAIVVTLTPGPGSRNPWCLDVPGGPQGGLFFAQDLPAAIRSRYRAAAQPAGWALLGDASGGYCALRLAMTSAWAFSAVAVPAGTGDGPVPLAAGASGQFRRQDSLLWLAGHQPMQPISILFTGTGLGRPSGLMSLIRPPARAAFARLAAGREPLAPVLDWLGVALRQGPRA